jgi:hypothetical protein
MGALERRRFRAQRANGSLLGTMLLPFGRSYLPRPELELMAIDADVAPDAIVQCVQPDDWRLILPSEQERSKEPRDPRTDPIALQTHRDRP